MNIKQFKKKFEDQIQDVNDGSRKKVRLKGGDSDGKIFLISPMEEAGFDHGVDHYSKTDETADGLPVYSSRPKA